MRVAKQCNASIEQHRVLDADTGEGVLKLLGWLGETILLPIHHLEKKGQNAARKV